MPRRRRDPIREHASLSQSGVVQMLAARPSLPVVVPTRPVVTRRFDDGRSLAALGTPDTDGGPGASEYDVAKANPRFDPATSMGLAQAATGGESCDVAEANPGFDPTPYEDAAEPATTAPAAEAPAAPAQTTPPAAAPRTARAQPATPTRSPARTAPAKATPSAAPAPAADAGARANSFTSREMRKLVEDDDFRADLDAILNGGTPAAEPRAQAQTTPPKRPAPSPQPAPAQPSIDDAAAALSEPPGEHAIFDKIAKNMRYATAYDLAPVSFGRRFDSFDRHAPRRPPAAHGMTKPTPAAGAPAAPVAQPAPSDTGAHRQDEAPAAAPPSPAPTPARPAEEMPPPQTLRPYSEAERVATYGDPRPDPAAWAEENVTQVEVPQLVGVPTGDGDPSDGTVAFNRLGARSLTDLFAAWETAGLMSQILTIDTAHAADAPHPGGAAHQWAIAFDINAEWNPARAQPAAVGDKGAVRDLVAIANRHGFVWGGHDSRNPAGLHFELGHRI